MTHIIAIANQKGGCGKTTTAVNLGACLGRNGEKVLLVDLDPQCHATIGLGDPEAAEGPGIVEAVTGWTPRQDQEVIRTVAEGLDLLPSSWRLSDLEMRLIRNGDDPALLRQALLELSGSYTHVVLDCPPSTGPLTRAALSMADLLLVPVETSFFALYGVGRMLALVEQEENRRGRPLLYRILLTLFDRRTGLAREVLREVREHFGERLLNTVIAINVSLREAASHGQAITDYRRRSRGFRDHMELADEVLATLGAHEEQSRLSGVAVEGG